uniref:Ubiquitin carboxyl-terminal hydrolase 36 n=1 Tax=Lygus hesperus TaxID=30085 RepID=A0A0A9YVU3_LYGHE
MITCLGKKGGEVFNMLGLDDTTSYNDVIKTFDEHCGQKKNSVYERFLFNRIVQHEGRSFDSFLIELKSQAACCDFNENEKDKLIRDRVAKRQTGNIHGDGKTQGTISVDSVRNITKSVPSTRQGSSGYFTSGRGEGHRMNYQQTSSQLCKNYVYISVIRVT